MDEEWNNTNIQAEHSFDKIFKAIEKTLMSERVEKKKTKVKRKIGKISKDAMKMTAAEQINKLHCVEKNTFQNRKDVDRIFRKQAHSITKKWKADLVKHKAMLDHLKAKAERLPHTLHPLNDAAKRRGKVERLQNQFINSQRYIDTNTNKKLKQACVELKSGGKVPSSSKTGV